MLLVTGATGHLGTAVIENLLKEIKPEKIAIYARDEKKAKKWKDLGISVRLGDFKDIEAIKNACIGIDSLLLIPITDPDSFTQHKNVIDAAVINGVKHLYYAGGAINHDIKNSKLGLIKDSYFLTENYIRQSGIQYTIFQNGLYADTIPFFIGADLPVNGINFPAGNGKSAFATRDDMGEAMSKIILKKDNINVTYMLSGNRSYSFAEVADLLTELSGKKILFLDSDSESFASALKEYGATEEEISIALLFSEIIKNQEYDISDSTLEQILERKPTTLLDYLKATYFH